jgi:hypothetical protein
MMVVMWLMRLFPPCWMRMERPISVALGANRSGQQDFAWQISPSSTPGRTIGTRLVQYTETIRMHRQVFQQPAGRNVTNEA